jgi:hypothetical protein
MQKYKIHHKRKKKRITISTPTTKINTITINDNKITNSTKLINKNKNKQIALMTHREVNEATQKAIHNHIKLLHNLPE